MPTSQLYDHTVNLFVSGANSTADTYKVILLSSAATFVAAATTVDEVTNSGANEVSGNGWTAGGMTIGNPTITQVTTNDSQFSGDNIITEISGGDLGPFSAYVIVNSTDSKPLAYITLDAPETVTSGLYAQIAWPSDGIIKFTYTPA